MNVATRAAALNKFRNNSSIVARQQTTKVLVIYDVQLKNNEVPHVPLVINYGTIFFSRRLSYFIYSQTMLFRSSESCRRVFQPVRTFYDIHLIVILSNMLVCHPQLLRPIRELG